MAKKYWNKTSHSFEENKKVDDFLDDILRVYQKHDMSIRHEDSHGSFIISPLTKFDILWLQDAMIEDNSAPKKQPAKRKSEVLKRKKGEFKFYKK